MSQRVAWIERAANSYNRERRILTMLAVSTQVQSRWPIKRAMCRDIGGLLGPTWHRNEGSLRGQKASDDARNDECETAFETHEGARGGTKEAADECMCITQYHKGTSLLKKGAGQAHLNLNQAETGQSALQRLSRLPKAQIWLVAHGRSFHASYP